MSEIREMSSPVTHGELREELRLFEQKLDDKLERLEQKFDQRIDHKLELWTGALLARIGEQLVAMERRLMAELGRHSRANQEDLTVQIRVVDEKYADLPARVAALEQVPRSPAKRPRRRA